MAGDGSRGSAGAKAMAGQATRLHQRLASFSRCFLFSELLSETVDANHGAFVQAACDQPSLLARFDLEIHLASVHVVNAGDAGDLGTQKRRSEMP